MKRAFSRTGFTRRFYLSIITSIFLCVGLFVGLMLRPVHVGAQGPTTPAETPDASVGLELFAGRCANCHGTLGEGDGELASELPRPPASLADQAFNRRAVPSELFATITNGILTSGMPPFGPESTNPISEQDRWNLVAAVYALGTSEESIADGESHYAENCAECHGEDGAGADPDLSSAAYWSDLSNATLFDALLAAEIEEHQGYELSEDELWSVIDYVRTFSYEYANPLAAFEPIASATITGTVTNASTGDLVDPGTPVVLNAFTPEFEPSLTLTTTVDSAGQYQFDLEMAAPDLVYIVTVPYGGLNQGGSSFQRLQRSDPALEIPVSVYDTTSDDATIRVAQLHIILEFAGESVRVSELYQFVQDAPFVYLGPSGDPDEGTIRVAVPDEAQAISFDRSFGSLESFFPVESMIETDEGWSDTVSLRPDGVMNLLVSYALPYESGMELAHEVAYGVNRVNLVFPDVGVSLADADDGPWSSQGLQAMGQAGSFLNYSRPDLPADTTLSFTLEGRPRQAATASGTGGQRDSTSDLLIGGGVLLLAVAAGFYLLRSWQQGVLAGSQSVPAVAPSHPDADVRRDELLTAIAALDDAYQAGTLEKGEYEIQRRELKDELLSLWQEHES